MKHTVKSAFLGEVQPFLNGDTMHQEDYQAAKNGIHTAFVQKSIAEMGTCPVLNAPRLSVDSSEQSLPRKVRSTLSQLRSGHCIALNSYKHKLGLSDSPLCPDCGDADQTTRHLFECEANHTTLEVADLWRDPRRAARFLASLPSFAFLNPPPRQPPPEPPP